MKKGDRVRFLRSIDGRTTISFLVVVVKIVGDGTAWVRFPKKVRELGMYDSKKYGQFYIRDLMSFDRDAKEWSNRRNRIGA